MGKDDLESLLNSAALVQKLWNYCNVLRDDGMSYGDYVEQLMYLLFLNLADECSRLRYSQSILIPARCAFPALIAKDGDALFDYYHHSLEELGKQPGSVALIFGKAQNRFQDPAGLLHLIGDCRRALGPQFARVPVG